jgi:hypothetical protein
MVSMAFAISASILGVKQKKLSYQRQSCATCIGTTESYCQAIRASDTEWNWQGLKHDISFINEPVALGVIGALAQFKPGFGADNAPRAGRKPPFCAGGIGTPEAIHCFNFLSNVDSGFRT